MPSHMNAEPLTPAHVFDVVAPLLRRSLSLNQESPRCDWCHGPAVWTTGNKTRCTVCGYVPS